MKNSKRKESKKVLRFQKTKKEKGITLIALVITIIVLLILAGVTIATLIGDNGILIRANEAKENTKIEEDKEKIKLAISEAQIGENGYQELTTSNLNYQLIKDGTKCIVTDNEDDTKKIIFLDSKKTYKLCSNGNIEDLNIDFDSEFVAPNSQNEERNNGVIGIGTDGNPVDMDLWEYTPLDDGTYGLNDKNVFIENYVASSGYSNDNLVAGKIQGSIPQYIKTSNDSEFIAVTNINYLFYNTALSEAPTIPCTITNMRATFNSCSNLTSMPLIPYGVTNMYGTFTGCSNLTNITDIPNSVTNMYGTFLNCTSLFIAPVIPNSVTNMYATFRNCISLTEVPAISNNVTDMQHTFRECSSLLKVPSIPNSVKNMLETFNGCTSLAIAPQIPNSVINMYGTFRGCTSLSKPPTIPNRVTVLVATFSGCSNLQGTLEINANVIGKQLGEEFGNNIDYYNCLLDATTNSGLKLKVTGSCPVLQQIVENANNPNITLNYLTT